MGIAVRGESHSGKAVLDQEEADLHDLITNLGSSNCLARQSARSALVKIGRRSASALVSALSSPNELIRWEAAKALSAIGDPAAAPALVEALEDDDFSVRWLAAEGLIAIGLDGLPVLYRALIQHSDSSWLREGAHHVLHNLAVQGFYESVDIVLVALQGMEPVLEVPFAAEAGLARLAVRSGHGVPWMWKPGAGNGSNGSHASN